MTRMCNRLGIDIGSTTVKIAIIDKDNNTSFQIMNVILQISEKLFYYLFKKLMMPSAAWICIR